MEEDIKAMVKQVTAEAKLFINSNAELYREMKKNPSKGSVEKLAYKWAEEHNHEFGTLFEPELDAVDWAKVVKGCF